MHPPGPTIRTDIVDVYIFRQQPAVELLQLRRASGQTLAGTWQPVMGHMHPGETAAQTALRELAEETGFAPGAGLLGFWQLETPNTYFLHSHETIVMSPCFAAEVAPQSQPTLDADHDAHHWLSVEQADQHFIWPGQRLAIAQITRDVIPPGSAVEPILRIDPEQL